MSYIDLDISKIIAEIADIFLLNSDWITLETLPANVKRLREQGRATPIINSRYQQILSKIRVLLEVEALATNSCSH